MALLPRLVVLSLLALTTILVTSTHLLPCSSRTTTTNQTLFEISRPDPVTYDFLSHAPSIVLTIPPFSTWHSDEAFHNSAETCASLHILSGWWVLLGRNAGITFCHAGSKKAQHPLMFLSWSKNNQKNPQTSASLELTAPVQFYRSVCSVTQDAELFYRLCTTPLWLRSLYSATYLIPFLGPSLREWMIDKALWYQLRVVYEANDFWTYEGEIPFNKWYAFVPEWARKRQIESMFVISRKVVRFASWVGRRMMGMKDSYEEYSVVKDQLGQTFTN
jgi:hypothetical protein